ncbi:type III-A CRISPR-associated RAMP protein Csm4 [Agriterribacter sp.]|uniref:type III-A CRISPR-associated RAMP protein Csm4 n=1 Tax=Agriterribacter sp. TaxID=2821509 RepID=UPI002C17F53C|nr:type III-A CRISPR-associated RAMP protein Csm4 [Agriterribacter sp.]HRP56365.1 type III-A CRISPR-associated RAMP protein Csm4 [Agriterribacter sp.]
MLQYNFDIIRFRFTTPLHIGNERSDYSTGAALLQSDALYAAICHAWARLGKAEWIPAEENEHYEFTVSSLFPFINYEEGSSYFLPRPMLLLGEKEPGLFIDTSVRKALKKIQWVDIPVFEALASGNPLEHNKTFFDNGYQSVKELSGDGKKKPVIPISNQVMPRASISRTGMEDTLIYYIDRYYFHERAGLYAIVKFENEEMKSKVLSALRLLEEDGLGTDRNVGHGKFKCTFDQVSIHLPGETDYAVNIGMYCPGDKKEWEAFTEYGKSYPRSGFSLLRRGGWMSEPRNTWRKCGVYMAQPGGVFKTSGSLIAGKVVNVEPIGEGINTGHPVWRNGRSIFLPCKG